jgi:hypothetical protein
MFSDFSRLNCAVGTHRPGGFARGYLGLSEVRRGDRAALPGVRGEVHDERGPGVFRVSDFARSIYSRPLIAGPRRGVLGQGRLLIRNGRRGRVAKALKIVANAKSVVSLVLRESHRLSVEWRKAQTAKKLAR